MIPEIIDSKETRLGLVLGTLISFLGSVVLLRSEFLGVASIIAVVVLLFASRNKTILFLMPSMLIFYEYLVLPGGLSVWRVYTFLLVVFYISHRTNLELNNRHKIYVIIAVLYSLIVILGDTMQFQKVAFLIFDILVFCLYLNCIDSKNIVVFSEVLIIAVCCSGVFGVLSGSSESTMVEMDRSYVETQRLLGTFTDPNYFSIFVNAAIFSTIIISKIPTFIRFGTVLLLYYILLATASMTALSANIIGILVILIFQGKIRNRRAVFLVSLIIFGVIGMVLYLSSRSEASFMNHFITRLTSKFLMRGDVNDLTSNRTDLWLEHLSYYFEQSPFAILFGGNRMSAVSTVGALSHQEYVDLLLCVGFVGACLLLFPNIVHTINMVKLSNRTGEEGAICGTMFKFLYFYYGFGLTMYLDYKFFIFALL